MTTILISMIIINYIVKANLIKDGQDKIKVIVVEQTKEVGEMAVLRMINTGIIKVIKSSNTLCSIIIHYYCSDKATVRTIATDTPTTPPTPLDTDKMNP